MFNPLPPTTDHPCNEAWSARNPLLCVTQRIAAMGLVKVSKSERGKTEKIQENSGKKASNTTEHISPIILSFEPPNHQQSLLTGPLTLACRGKRHKRVFSYYGNERHASRCPSRLFNCNQERAERRRLSRLDDDDEQENGIANRFRR